jgi:hypothetical protein
MIPGCTLSPLACPCRCGHGRATRESLEEYDCEGALRKGIGVGKWGGHAGVTPVQSSDSILEQGPSPSGGGGVEYRGKESLFLLTIRCSALEKDTGEKK